MEKVFFTLIVVALTFVIVVLLLPWPKIWIPPIKYWVKNPENFVQCKEATRGMLILTKPPKCEFRGRSFQEDEWQGYR